MYTTEMQHNLDKLASLKLHYDLQNYKYMYTNINYSNFPDFMLYNRNVMITKYDSLTSTHEIYSIDDVFKILSINMKCIEKICIWSPYNKIDKDTCIGVYTSDNYMSFDILDKKFIGDHDTDFYNQVYNQLRRCLDERKKTESR